MTKQEKILYIIDDLIALAVVTTNGENADFVLSRVPSDIMDSGEVYEIFVGLAKKYPALLFVPRLMMTGDFVLNFVTISKPSVSLLKVLKMLVMEDIVGDYVSSKKSDVLQKTNPEQTMVQIPSVQDPLSDDAIFRIEKTNKKISVLHIPSQKSYVLCHPRFHSRGEQLLEYAIKNKPNQRFTLLEASKEVDAGRAAAQVFGDLGFNGIIKKAFVDVSANGILLTVSLTQRGLFELGITEAELLKALQSGEKQPNTNGKKRKREELTG